MPYLIDGNNLLGAARDARLALPRTERELIRVLSRFAGRRRGRLTIVFDGPPGSRQGGAAGPAAGVKVIYSGAGRTADDVILEMAERSRAPGDIVLVTSDRALRSRARGLGCRLMGCAEFAARLSAAGEPAAGEEDKPAAGDAEEWLRWFSSRGPRGPSS